MSIMMLFTKSPRTLTICSVLALATAPAMTRAQDCSLYGDALPAGCEQANADLVVVTPVGANTEVEAADADLGDAGFSITIDGDAMVEDKRVEHIARQADVALSQADLRVQFDGLGAKPRLDLDMLGPVERPDVGDSISLQSRLNYPSYVTRGELRVIDRGARGGPKTLTIVPIDPNGSAALTVPDGKDVVVVHRVYDAQGRFDETAPLSLMRPDDRPLTDEVEEGTDTAAKRAIPVNGGAVTVSGTGVRAGAVVNTLGEVVQPDPSGNFVLQRILPAGDHAVQVKLDGAGENTHIERDITIPKSDWFYVATADLTFGRRFLDDQPDRDFTEGRLAFYTKGKTAGGWTITASADTGEHDINDLFRDFDRKDPYNVLNRLDPDDAYPVYGDDSTIEQDAPTDGKFYVKAEKNGSHLMWGNYVAQVEGGTYLRNERTLYGAQGYYVSPQTTSRGQPRATVTAYAAQPDQLPGRDIFRGTGGSAYFLQRQDVAIGSETITVEVRDKDTGRVVETRTLSPGRDYDINYLQGLVTLSAPLTGSTGSGTLVTNPGGEFEVRLVVQYEFTPTTGDIDGYTYGGRVESWVTDTVRLGFTGMVEQTDLADQEAWGADIRWELSENTFFEAEYAESDGPGFGSSFSDDGGLIITNTPGVGGTGHAINLRGQAELTELGLGVDGTIAGYFEERTAGFSSLDYQTTVDETLWGVAADFDVTERTRFKLYYDDFEDANGKHVREGGAEIYYEINDRVTLGVGVEHQDRNDTTDPLDTGERTDVALRVDVEQSDALAWYVYGQTTVERSGGLRKNDRVGAGLKLDFSEQWTVEAEYSDGSLGPGGLLMFTYARDTENSGYAGYRLEPGRDFQGVTLNGRDEGQFVAGGRRKVNDRVDVFAENTYDMFGTYNSLGSTYGVEYAKSDYLTYSGAYELAQIDDPVLGDFERHALSLGMRYQDEAGLNASVRFEYRQDRGTQGGTIRDGDSYHLVAAANYEIDQEQRLLFSFDGATTTNKAASFQGGDYAELTFGYAYRPIEDDRLNVLLKYTYLYDMYGQLIDGTNTPGPVQESHIFTADAIYDLNPHWSLGGKVGVRLSESAPNPTTPQQRNDAILLVANLRYHLTHEWDVLLETRHLEADQAGISETSLLGAIYRHVGNNFKVGVGYNFGTFSDDLSDLTYDDKGAFINLIAKF
ncbi:MAG: hypothetical protein AB8B82_10880 [Roseovarius sp.]